MKIESAAGEFEFEIESLKIDANDIVLSGQMGVWEAETTMSRDDAVQLFGLMLRSPAFWSYAIRLPLYALFGRQQVAESNSNDG
jgi:hypothetical protein